MQPTLLFDVIKEAVGSESDHTTSAFYSTFHVTKITHALPSVLRALRCIACSGGVGAMQYIFAHVLSMYYISDVIRFACTEGYVSLQPLQVHVNLVGMKW